MEITLDKLKTIVPSNCRNNVTENLVTKLNTMNLDEVERGTIQENFISYTGILKDSRFTMDEYLNAIKYVSFKLLGKTNRIAYEKTFPDRYANLVADGRTEKEISAYISSYNKGKLVNLIYEQSIVPSWVLNNHFYQEAVNTQVGIMRDVANSAFVRSNAASILMQHLSKPEKVAQLDISISNEGDNSAINTLAKALDNLSSSQVELIKKGHLVAGEVTKFEIIDGEYDE